MCFLLTYPASSVCWFVTLANMASWFFQVVSQSTTLKSKTHTQSLSVVPPATDSIAVNGCFTDPAGGM